MRGEDRGGMKFLSKKTGLITALAVVGVLLMLAGIILPHTDENEEKSNLESRFEEAILKLEGISEADVIIQRNGEEITGAVAVCKGGGDGERETVTKLLCSGLDLPANRIYVVCN